MAKIKKGIEDFASGFHIKQLAEHLQYLIDEYYDNQIVAHTEARPDLGVDWWTAEYLADNIEKIADSLKAECENLRAYANSGERRPLEDWQNAFNKSTKKSKIKKESAIGDIWDRIDILKDEMGCENLLEETYRALPSDKANETLEYIARNHDIEFDEPEYMASTKKSKMKKSKPTWEQFMGNLNGAVDGVLKDFDLFTLDFRINTRGTSPFNPVFLEDVREDFNLLYNDYEASAKKSKSFNEMIKEQREQYKNKKVM